MASAEFSMLRCGLAGVGAVEAETRHVFPRHWHEQYGIGVIHRGAQRSWSGRGMVEAGAGDVITVNPGEVHDGMPVGDGARAWTMLYVDPALIGALAADLSEGRTAFYEWSSPVISDGAAALRFRRAFAGLTGGDGESPASHGEELLLALLGAVPHEHSGFDGARAPESAIRRARQRIDDEPLAAVTLAELARDCGLSRFQLLRGFARATGLTPHAYLVQRRIDLARRLIAAGEGLAEAAAASGFADQSHMTRTFVRRYGLSPGRYAGALA
ncbi:AraC family transcriptional regulator [Labrys monachus]|uniref:AraC family transcriptional regulator n=1 Tax=Labrys monachus TaxID=217067 RepID=UPI0027D8822B|nr:AraC family transcriptional regulator [Labrys monachus]